MAANKLKIIPLGGLGEVGKNMTAIEYGRNVVLIDAGGMFPEDDMYGIDLVLPDYTHYLAEKKSWVRGIIVTHGHEDHIGAMPYLLETINVPIYVVSCDLSCLTQIEGGLRRRGSKVRARHIAEVLAEGLAEE
jgi:ribonuclease J